MGDRLQDGEKLEVGQSLTSANGAYRLILQDDGNLVLYTTANAWTWQTFTYPGYQPPTPQDPPPPSITTAATASQRLPPTPGCRSAR